MNELEQLKEQAAERHATVNGGMGWDDWKHLEEVLSGYATDLDAAIAIAEAAHRAGDILLKESVLIADALTVAQSERDEARAAAAALRHFIETEFEYAEHDMNQDPVTMVVDVHSDTCSLCQARALLEQYR